MANFLPSVSLQQSLSGGSVIITDTSNYSTNTEGVTLANIGTRSYTVTDGDGTAIASGTFAEGLTTATFNLAKDAYLHTALSFILPSTAVRTGENNYLASNYYNSVMVKKAKKVSSNCCSCKLCDNTMKSLLSKEASEFYYSYGFAVNSQELIEDANILINS